MVWRREDELQRLLRDSADAFVAAGYGMPRVRRSRALADGFDPAAWRQMAELGWAGALIDEDRGGAGLGLAAMLGLAERFGGHLLPEPLAACAVIAASVLAKTEAVALTTRLVTGERLYTLAFQEQLNQSGVVPISALLTPAGDGFRLSGAKIFVPAWSADTDLLVTAMRGGDMAVVHVRQDAAGLGAATRRMADGSLTADLRFDTVAIAPADVLLTGDAAEDALDIALARGMLCLSAQLEGLAASAFRMTAGYLAARVQFGQPLVDFQALRHQMVDLHIGIELAGASWRQALAVLETSGPAEAAGAIAAAKARAGQAALDMARGALQLHGAMGYTEEADVGLILNAALRWSTWLGNAAAHRRAAYRQHQAEAAHVQ